MEGLTRAQRRLEDQRGTEINFELPDFLKDKESHQTTNNQQKQGESRGDTRFYVEESSPLRSKQDNQQTAQTNYSKRDIPSMYENRSILVPEEQSQNQTSPLKNNLRVRSSSDNSSTQSTPTKGLNSTVIENQIQGRQSDPPPLPPKPKIVPIKPPNWGQVNGFNKFKDLKTTNRNQTMYLEQQSSSFV